ncbi:MAG: hypothetical protein RLZZ337_2057 [Bacteroidota bacterium]|jgi:hypothetical protein
MVRSFLNSSNFVKMTIKLFYDMWFALYFLSEFK